MNPQTAWTVDFTVTIDRAGHLVVEQIAADGTTVRAIDFGINPDIAPVILTWLEFDGAARGEMAPAINAYLAAEFAKRS